MIEFSPLFPVNREHLERMTGEFGICQHAYGLTPNLGSGTCSDDVARALVVDFDHAETLGPEAVAGSVLRSLKYLEEAFNGDIGRFRNFRGASGGWLEELGSEDCHGRVMFALGQAQTRYDQTETRQRAVDLFARALPAAGNLTSIRAMSAASLACASLPDEVLTSEARSLLEGLSRRLLTAFSGDACTADWPWPEEVITYDGTLPARALISAGARLEEAAMIDLGLRLFDWLLEHEIDADGQFSPIGNRGWWLRGRVKTDFDQQPIEAGSLILTAEVALSVAPKQRYLTAAERAYSWFLGANKLGIKIADPEHGGCRDGLGPDGINTNEGAESTLMWLSSLEAMRRLRKAGLKSL
jgi:hypothetical protein